MFWTMKQLRLIRGLRFNYADNVPEEIRMDDIVTRMLDVDFRVRPDDLVSAPRPETGSTVYFWRPKEEDTMVLLRGGGAAGKTMMVKDIHYRVQTPSKNVKRWRCLAEDISLDYSMDIDSYSLAGWDDRRHIWVLKRDNV